MINQDTVYNIKNRSSSVVVYRIPEAGIRREFAPGEVKKIAFGELEKLTYRPGGRELLENFLQIGEEDVTTQLNVHRDVEYDMSEAEVRELLLTGSLDAFLDALDFAPIGVMDLIKALAVSLPLTDLNKRRALREKTGFDVDKALIHMEEDQKAEQEAKDIENKTDTNAVAPTRRVSKTTTTTTRRVTTPNYKVVNKEQ